MDIGKWVLENACMQAMQWLNLGFDFGRVAVNVSGAQLQSDFIQTIAEILRKTQLPPESLELEITETFLMTNLAHPIKQLEKLRAIGVSLSIDDFGVGYSSLIQLKQLPVHRLKIDRSFIRGIVNDDDDRAIVQAIIALSKSLQLEVTAEGVETQRQLELLKQYDCTTAQGYFLQNQTQLRPYKHYMLFNLK